MAQLVSLEMTKKEQKARDRSFDADEGPRFPFGTMLHLEDETVTKLGAEDLEAGQAVVVSARATVSSVNSSDDERGKRTSVSLQLTEMAVEGERSNSDRAKAMFPNTEGDS